MSTIKELFTSPERFLIVIILLVFGGERMFTNFFATQPSDVLAELQELKRDKAEDELKEEIIVELTSIVDESLRPMAEAIRQINEQMNWGQRWSLEDMQRYHDSGGEQSPKYIHMERLAGEMENSLRAKGGGGK